MTSPAADIHDQAPRPQRPRFDGTINIPTVLTLLAMIVCVLSSGLAIYGRLDERITKNASTIQLLQSQQTDARSAAEQSRMETSTALLRMDSKLDRLLWDRGDRHSGVSTASQGSYQ